jgi:Subtilase family
VPPKVACRKLQNCLLGLGIAGLVLLTAPGAIAQCSGHAQLNLYERTQFLQVSMGHRNEVLAQFLSETGCGEQMLQGLTRLGATIDFADKTSGYALVSIAREKLLETLDLRGIAYAYARDDGRIYAQDPAAKIPQSDRKAEPVPAITIPYPRVATTLPKDGPYFAAKEIGLPELRKQHPEADGRGVRVAVADEGFDLLHPALQNAMEASGKTVPKIADLGTLTTPDEDSGWVRFGDPVQTKNGSFEAAGRTWIAPEDGTYRFGIFKTDLVLGPEDNSKTKKLSLSVGVLWDEHGNRVWVDTDGDGSFKNQRALGDYGSTHDVDWFGAKEGENDNRIPFGVKMDAAQNSVYIRIGGEHGAFVGGPLAGNQRTGGLFDGAAPSAQLIDENLGRATLIASLVRMFARPDVDVINRSGGLGRAGYTGDREGIEDFAQRVVERVIAVYNKPIATYSAAVGTIHVNDYAGPEMLRRNRQVGPPYRDTINSFVWFLPNGLVNVVVAPSANLETDSRYKPQNITWDDGKLHSFSDDRFSPPAPDGYVIGANNSPTIPVVSGLLADLISEAKREHVRYNAMRLNNAVFTGTRLLVGFPPSQQGYGLIDAAHSWDQLSKMAKADDPKNPELTSFTLSRVDGGKTIEVQGFHADLAKPGESLNGEILITRRGGYAGDRKYTLSLRGNDGSFVLLDQEVTLDRDKPARVRFRTNGASGWHTVFLELRDAKADVVMQDVPLSVRVPDVPESIAPGVEEYESTIEPLRSESRFPRVDEDVQAARYVMKIPYTGPENISTRDFPGGRYRETKAPPGEPVDAAHHVGPMETLESLVANDEPGTQQIFWENRGRPEYATQYDGPAPDVAIHAELTVTKYAVGIQKDASENLTVSNKLAEVEGKVELYDATLKSTLLLGAGPHASGDLERTLPAGLAQWRVRVTADSTASEPADVYLLNCAGKEGCSVAAQQQISAAGKTIVVEKPQDGAWKIVVRSRGQVSQAATYEVRESLLVATQTAIEQADSKRASGETWTVALPVKASDAQYVAFKIAGTVGNEKEKNGLVIAMTALDANAP